jgi:uncharacterized membrane protein YfcA
MTWKAAGLFVIPIGASIAASFLLRGRVPEEVEFGVSMFVLILTMYPFNRHLARGRTKEGGLRPAPLQTFPAHLAASAVGALAGTLGLLLFKALGWY